MNDNRRADMRRFFREVMNSAARENVWQKRQKERRLLKKVEYKGGAYRRSIRGCDFKAFTKMGNLCGTAKHMIEAGLVHVTNMYDDHYDYIKNDLRWSERRKHGKPLTNLDRLYILGNRDRSPTDD